MKFTVRSLLIIVLFFVLFISSIHTNSTKEGNVGERDEAILYFLETYSKKYNNPDGKNIKYNTLDRGNENPNEKEYSMCYNKSIPELEKYCGPDSVFYHWPSANIHSFETEAEDIMAASKRPYSISKAAWTGNIYSPEEDVIESKTRPLLKKIGDENPDIFDIVHVSPVKGVIDEKSANYSRISDLMKYKYLIDIGGNGWSGRLKFLLFSNRPILLVDRKYIEYFYNDLIPYEHYIPVKTDLSDLITQVKWADAHPKECERIAKNARNFALQQFTLDKLLERVHYVYGNLQN